MRTKIFGVLSAAALVSGCSFGEPQMIGFCENILKERLRSPSAYKRIEVKDYTVQISPAEWEAIKNQETPDSKDFHSRIAAIAAAANERMTHFKFAIEYDAPNAYGTPIRGRVLCDYLSDSDRPPSYEGSVKVDGMTHTEWLISQLSR